MRTEQRIDEDVIKLLPNFITYQNAYGRKISRIYSHDKFAKRICFAFSWLWTILHWLDMEVLPELNIAYNFGFDTYQIKPVAGSGGASCDGMLTHTNGALGDTFANTVGGSGGSITADVSSTTLNVMRLSAYVNGNKWANFYKGYMSFFVPIGAMPSSDGVSQASLNMSASTKTDTLGDALMTTFYSAGGQNNLASGDWSTITAGSVVGTVAYATWSLGSYTKVVLPQSLWCGYKTSGLFGFGSMYAGGEPGWSANNICQVVITSADQVGQTSSPYLEVIHWSTGTATKISGDNQTGTAFNTALANPLVSTVNNNGALMCAIVTYTVTASPSGSSGWQFYNASGVAQGSSIAVVTETDNTKAGYLTNSCQFAPGNRQGTYTITATESLSGTTVTFTVTLTIPADITAATDSNPIEITTVANPHNFVNGQLISISGAYIDDGNGGATLVSNVNGNWDLYVTAVNKAKLVNSKSNGTWIGGGTITKNNLQYR